MDDPQNKISRSLTPTSRRQAMGAASAIRYLCRIISGWRCAQHKMGINKATIQQTLRLVAETIQKTGLVREFSYQIEQPQPTPSEGPHWAVKVSGKINGRDISVTLFLYNDGDYMFENSLHEGPDRVTFERKNAGTLARLITAYLFAKNFAAPIEKAFDTYFFPFCHGDGYDVGCRLSAIKRFSRTQDGGWYRLEVWVTLRKKTRRPVFDIRWFTEEAFGKSGSIEGDFEVADKAFRGLLLEIFL